MDWLTKLKRALEEFTQRNDRSGSGLTKAGTESVPTINFITVINVNNDNRIIDKSVGARVGAIYGNVSDSLNTINKFKGGSSDKSDLANRLANLHAVVQQLVKELPEEDAERASRDLKSLVDEVTSKKPRKEWYEISAKGLIDATKTVAKMAAPITTTVKAVLELLG